MNPDMLILDIDDTILPSSCTTEMCRKKHEKLVNQLLDYCDDNNIDVAINTARPVRSLNGVTQSIQARLKNKPFCYRPYGSKKDVPERKQECMIRLSKNRNRQRVTLMDDRMDNCVYAQKAGFKAIHVIPDGKGITVKDVDKYMHEQKKARTKKARTKKSQK